MKLMKNLKYVFNIYGQVDFTVCIPMGGFPRKPVKCCLPHVLIKNKDSHWTTQMQVKRFGIML